MKIFYCFTILVFFCGLKFGAAQQVKSDSIYKKVEVHEVVVTATRSEEKIENIPAPVTIITSKEIQSAGFNRLNDVLAELNGAAVVDYFGRGLQMQGLDPAYTLIMIDNQPLIGRNGGTYDLSKIPLGNIERIEVVKGPSSALYGSEALAGVVNIITKKPEEGITSSTALNYGSNQTTELSENIGYSNKKFSTMIFGDGFYTSGYDLNKATLYLSGGRNLNGTVQTKTNYSLNSKYSFSLDARYYHEKVSNKDQFSENNVLQIFDLTDYTTEFSITPGIRANFNNNTTLTLNNFFTIYDYHSIINYADEGAIYYDDKFRHYLNKPEIIFDKKIGSRYRVTSGAGYTSEKVVTTRYDNDKHLTTSFAFAEAQATILKKMLLVAGGRMDHSSVYGYHFSPKVATQYTFSKKVRVFASWGTGFKAPDFRQLYLNFTNSVVGYSVFGSEELNAQLSLLQSEGMIAHVITDPAASGNLIPENSNSYNAGANVKVTEKLSCKVDVFRNDISDLIETQAIAQKTNGQYVYSYLNLDNVFTQGVQPDISFAVNKNISASGGYQFLNTGDKQVIADIKAGKIFARDPITSYSYKVSLDNYGGLFNRSAHSFNIKLQYLDQKYHWGFSLRYIYRGKYGFADINGNSILDSPDEYVKGYGLINFATTKEFSKHFSVRATVNNVGGYTDTENIPSLSGRTYFVSLLLNFNNKNSK